MAGGGDGSAAGVWRGRAAEDARRLALLVRGIADKAEDLEERAEGPAISVAFGPDGAPTKAAEGFARKFALTVDQLDRSGLKLIATRKRRRCLSGHTGSRGGLISPPAAVHVKGTTSLGVGPRNS